MVLSGMWVGAFTARFTGTERAEIDYQCVWRSGEMLELHLILPALGGSPATLHTKHCTHTIRNLQINHYTKRNTIYYASVLIIQCFICKVSLLFSALYAKCPYYLVVPARRGKCHAHVQFRAAVLRLAWVLSNRRMEFLRKRERAE